MSLLQPSLEKYWDALNSAEDRVVQTLEGSGVMGPRDAFGKAASLSVSAAPVSLHPVNPYRRPGLN